jgi:hypothetical protein
VFLGGATTLSAASAYCGVNTLIASNRPRVLAPDVSISMERLSGVIVGKVHEHTMVRYCGGHRAGRRIFIL